jgi:hypothetical protein
MTELPFADHQTYLNQWFNDALTDYLVYHTDRRPDQPTLAEIRAALADTAADAEAILKKVLQDDEDAYAQHQEQMADDSSYRRQMIDAGRGHLLKG